MLAELRSLGSLRVEELADDWKIRRAVERDLQVAVEIVIDVCQRILSLEQKPPAPTSADALARCVAMGILSDQPAYRRMTGFRHFLVHRYEQVDLEILVDRVNRRLEDFERFSQEIMIYVRH
ncbi:MAG: DUF86 domain-containing protein [Magnetococcus sp. YQC-5]